MKKAVIYIHGQGGNAKESEHYKPLFPDFEVIGFDYKAETPWDAKAEFKDYFKQINKIYNTIYIIANSIGAYFTMNADIDNNIIKQAYFISPIVDMERIIIDMMNQSGVTEDELQDKKEIGTLSWEYLCYVRKNLIKWNVPTHIIYGKKDNFTNFEIITEFAKNHCASLNVMPDGEHWFHTPEQMNYLDNWIINCIGIIR